MRDWLTIELVVAALLVTSFTSVGLLALWAATSPRHWFVRTAIVVGVLSPLLIVPALEPFLVLILQCGVVILGTLVYRRLHTLKQQEPNSIRTPLPSHTSSTEGRQNTAAGVPPMARIRFSLSTLLLCTVFAAIAAAIAVHFPRLNLPAWSTMSLHGVSSGIATLMGVWMFSASRRWLAGLLAIGVCIGTGSCLSMMDWFIPSLVDWTGWPPDPSNSLSGLGVGREPHPIIAWFFIPCLIALLTAFAVHRWSVGAFARKRAEQNCSQLQVSVHRLWLARCMLACFTIFIGALPLFVLGKLLTPDTIPDSKMPVPNGYDDLVAAGGIAAKSQFDGTLDVSTASAQQLTSEVAKCAKAFELVESGLAKECAVPVDYSFSNGDLPVDDFMSLRDLARSLTGTGRLAELSGRYAEATDAYLQSIGLGYAVRRNGLFVHALVGTACSESGAMRLYHLRDKLTSEHLRQCVAVLTRLDAHDESFDDIWYRDRVWSQRTNGWHGHLEQVLSDLADRGFVFLFISSDDYRPAYLERQASMRLLAVEIALEAFHQDHGKWPEALNELVPRYLVSSPLDPFDSQPHPLRYIRTPTGYSLYSIGPDGRDEAGETPTDRRFGWWQESGDLRLDRHFAPDDGLEENNGSSNGGTLSGEKQRRAAVLRHLPNWHQRG